MTPKPSADRDDPYLIRSLARGLAVLDAFSPSRPELTLADIAAAAEVTPASAVRIGHTLVTSGYMVRNPATKGFRPGPRMLGAGLATLVSLTLPEIAEPFLFELRDRSGETVNLAVPAESEMVMVFRAPSTSFPPAVRYPSPNLSYHNSSVGLAVLASLPSADAESILGRARPDLRTSRSLSVEAARAQFATIRRRGYAINDQGTTSGQRSLAAPVLTTAGEPVAAVNVSAPVDRVPKRDLERRLGPMVIEAAAAIGAMLPPERVGRPWSGFTAR